MNPLQALHELGQDVWLDALQRSYLEPGGYLETLVANTDISGLTSNPSIFQKGLADDETYEPAIAELKGTDPREAFWTIVKADVTDACDLFAKAYRSTDGRRGYVSIEVDPARAYDTEATFTQGLELFTEIDRPNLMVKVPGTEPGLDAVTRLIFEGVNVNVTLLFSVSRYEQVWQAFVEGLRRRQEAGRDITRIASVASFFISRVDAKVDEVLGEDSPMLATAAIANARVAYGSFEQALSSPEWQRLAEAGAQPQRPLWASTSTKSDKLPDTIYIDELAGPQTVTTMPESTLDAVRDHGGPMEDRISGTAGESRHQIERLAEQGVDLDQITKELETEGVEKFATAFDKAVETLAEQL